ncbi:hypothetical protein Y032_0005g2605 [Ancylostoma ceylanicum]|uniref:Reverse transcriptase domain-containing protein n=1 Tax=Ancylostoma ceylanicum TaxID=53326 RepID=A0A016VUB2_9BILA|nr:hypothetical protein Y032_0005g2605 [Ancylostoma ceylanicum]
MPEAWRDSIIVPIFKTKGDAMNCTKYRGIKLIAHTMKIYERLLDMRLREMVEISPDQFGFVPELSTIDAIFIARQLMEKYREKNKPCRFNRRFESRTPAQDPEVADSSCRRVF